MRNTSPRWSRKATFTHTEVAVFLSCLNEDRRVLQDNFSSNWTPRQRDARWQEIAERVSTVSVSQCRPVRTMKELKVKWQNLRKQALDSLKPGKLNGGVPQKECPYMDIILDILSERHGTSEQQDEESSMLTGKGLERGRFPNIAEMTGEGPEVKMQLLNDDVILHVAKEYEPLRLTPDILHATGRAETSIREPVLEPPPPEVPGTSQTPVAAASDSSSISTSVSFRPPVKKHKSNHVREYEPSYEDEYFAVRTALYQAAVEREKAQTAVLLKKAALIDLQTEKLRLEIAALKKKEES